MSEVKIRSNAFVFNGRAFFRAASETTRLGSYGPKRTPIGRPNRLEADSHLQGEKLKIREIGKVDIDFQKVDKREFFSEVSLLKIFGSASLDVVHERLVKHELELMQFEVDPKDMVAAINRSPVIREKLKHWGNDARVVTTVFVALKAEVAKKIDTKVDTEAEFTVQGVTIHPKVSLSSGVDAQMSFPIGVPWAYGLSKCEWDEKNENKATKVISLKFDPPGL